MSAAQQSPTPEGSRGARWAIIGIGAVAVLLVVVIIAVVIIRGEGPAPGDGESAGTASAKDLPTQATELATAHMDALVSGDVEAALAPFEEDPNSPRLPNEVYETALEEGPVADVELSEPVVEGEGLATATVEVSYTIAGEPAQGTIEMHDYDGDGSLALLAGLTGTGMIPERFAGLPVTLNGSEVEPGTSYVLLAGTYTIGVDDERFTVDESAGAATVLVGPEKAPIFATPMLSEAGQEQARERIIDSVEDCLEQDTLEAGCGITPVPKTSEDGWTAVEGTVERSMDEEERQKLEDMEVEVGIEDPFIVSGGAATFQTSFECTRDGRSGECELLFGGGTGVPSVDLEDPEAEVRWE